MNIGIIYYSSFTIYKIYLVLFVSKLLFFIEKFPIEWFVMINLVPGRRSVWFQHNGCNFNIYVIMSLKLINMPIGSQTRD